MTTKKYKFSALTFVSSSERKFYEYRDLFGFKDLLWSKTEVQESQNLSVNALVDEKLKDTRLMLPNVPFFVEHTALTIDAWRGLPGGLTRVFMETVGNDGICKMMRSYGPNERGARAVVVIGYGDPDGSSTQFQGVTVGSIAAEPRGLDAFGWDPIFIPANASRTYGEMTKEEKNRESMRRIACDQFRAFLVGRFEL